MSTKRGFVLEVPEEGFMDAEDILEAMKELKRLEKENRRLLAVEAQYRNHLCPPRSAADSQLQADIDALRTRVANLEFALHPESSRRQAVSVSEACRADAFRQAVAYLRSETGNR